MRHFVIKCRTARTAADFNMADLPGAGRIDIAARCVNAALWISHELRRDTLVHLILEGPPDPPKYIRFDPRLMKFVNPDERNIAIFLRKALGAYKKGKETESTPGVFVSRDSLQNLARRLKKEGTGLYVLHERGTQISEQEFSGDVAFFLGDHVGLLRADEKFLLNLGAKKISLGKQSYHASHCITIVNWNLDQRR